MVQKHVTEDRLLALMDGELGAEARSGVAAHVRECARCAGELEELRRAGRLLAAGLSGLDRSPPWDGMPERVRAALEARRAGAAREIPFPAERRRPGRRGAEAPSRRVLATAAALVLLAAGAAAAAIPGSPVRALIERSVEAVGTLFTAPEEPAAPASVQREGPSVAVEPDADRVVVAILGASPGVSVRVRVVDTPLASASASNARFRTARGRIEIMGAEGELVVELPRTVRYAWIEVNGRPILEKSGPDLRLLTPAADTSGSEIRFELGASSQ